MFSKFSKFYDFSQQQTHTSAQACTRHPAKHGSKGLTWGLDTAEHPLHCHVDHNSGCCSGYEPARREASGHYNYLPNLCATVAVYGDDAADQTGALHEGRINALCVGQKYLWSRVVGHRIGESRERGCVGIDWVGGRIEANVSDRINLDDRFTSMIL